MRSGLNRIVLNLVHRHAGIVVDHSGIPSADIAWMIPPDGPALFALQAERHADSDPVFVTHAADLDRDIARLRAGWWPDNADLTDAPILLAEGLQMSMSASPIGVQMLGPVYDPDGRQISRGRITSLVVAVDAEHGRWARTLNRFYRLAQHDAPASERDRP